MTKFFRGGILGSPGSGKGTLSSRVVQRFDVYHLSTGDLLRKAAEVGDTVEKSVKEYLDAGKLVPDDLVSEITIKKLKELENKNWLLDGFPRTLTQAEKLFMFYPLDLVISLNVPLEVIIERVKDRWIHPASGRTYNISYNPPRVPGKDDVTGQPLIQRADDNPETLKKRMEEYKDYAAPLLEFYKKQNILKEVSGNTSDQIWPLIEKELLPYMKPKPRGN